MSTNSDIVSDASNIPLLVESGDGEQFSLFPNESGGGVVITQQEMLQLSKTYSELYEIYISRLSVQLAEQFDLTEPAASLLARRALVPLVHCFLDRLVRVKKANDLRPGQLTIPRQSLFTSPESIEEFERIAMDDPVFNQSMIGLLGRIWQLPDSDPVNTTPRRYSSQSGFRNNLFLMHEKTTYHLIKKAVLRILSRLPKARFPALTMANATGAFSEYGFYFRFIEDVSPKFQLARKDNDRSLRKKNFTNDFVKNPVLEEFMEKLGLKDQEQERAIKIFKEYLQSSYPNTLFEAVATNMQQASKSLQKFKRKILFSSSGRDTRSTYVMAAAKKMNFKIVDLQHGGHYGYLEDVSAILELEYPGIDEFLSWGWSRLPDHFACKNICIIGLPSPWLSERKRYWKKLEIGGDKEFDLLLMPNMVKRFPAAPQGASTSRIDLIKDVADSLVKLVRATTEGGIKVLNKPYNSTTVGLLENTLQEMEEIGGDLYRLEKQLDKGLTYELLNRCHIVLWDQPGTGFLECLSSGIPTMVYWSRTCSQEEEWVQQVFIEMENQGVVHRQFESLVNEIKCYKKSPQRWMSDLDRQLSVSSFCNRFSKTSESWPKEWKSYFQVNNSVGQTCE